MFGRKKIERTFRQVEINLRSIDDKIHGSPHSSFDRGLMGKISVLEYQVQKLEADRDLLLAHLGIRIKTISKHDEIEKIKQ
jgi:hypothetical protein